MEGLFVQNISKSYEGKKVLDRVSFEVKQGEVLALLGPSGCGKSTLLSIVAGLEEADQGRIVWGGRDLRNTPSSKRGFGLMFQDYILFPHMNVFQNIAFGLRMDSWASGEIEERVAEVLDLVGLPEFGSRDVSSLSGGEQQRVALARSLAPGPKLLMLDEPLGALDRALRETLLEDLKDILHSSHQTALYVTHDQEEAFALADQVVVIREGILEQVGSPKDIYTHPKSAFVAEFLGLSNRFEVRVRDGLIETPFGDFPAGERPNGEVILRLRPDALKISGDGLAQLDGKVMRVDFRGGRTRLLVKVRSELLTVDISSREWIPPVNEEIQISFDPDNDLQIFDWGSEGE